MTEFPTAESILRAEHVDADADTSVFSMDSPNQQIDTIRVGSNVFTMHRGDDLGGDATNGYGYSYGVLVDDEFEPINANHWADTAEEAHQAIRTWLRIYS